MRLLAARRDEATSPTTVDRYLLAFDTWFAELTIGEGPIGRRELIDHLLDLRLRLTTIQQLEDSLIDPSGRPGDTDASPIDVSVPGGLERERSGAA
jgi:hypothetical protein